MNSKELELKVKDLIKQEFERYFDIVGSDYTIEFYNIDRQKELKEDIVNKLSRENNELEIKDIFDKNYIKILKQEEKKYKLDAEYKYNKMIQEASVEIQKENKRKEKEDTIFNIIKIIFQIIGFIIFLPIIFIIALLYGVMKNSK